MKLTYIDADELARLRDLDCDRFAKAQILADASRLNTLYMIRRAGSGHVGTSFSAMDIVNWLFAEEMCLEGDDTKSQRPDVYFSSKGHDVPGFYATMISLGRMDFEKIHTLRQFGGLPGHPDVHTELVEANTGSLGMGVSKAKGMIKAAEVAGEKQRCYVLFGDGELQEGQFWESLVSAANHKIGDITAIVDHNKIQSDTWVEFVSDLGDLPAKFAAFGWEVARIDGHDLNALADTLERFNAITDKPKIILADTIKGKGVSFMEPGDPKKAWEQYFYHSGAPSPEDYAKAVEELSGKLDAQLKAVGAEALSTTSTDVPDPQPKTGQGMVKAYSQAILEQAERRPDLIAMDGDLVLDTGLIPFMQKYPERYLECGIAEMDMVSQAGGMALKGALPIVHSFACFLSPRPNEQIYNNATEFTKVIYVGSLAGVLPAGPGHSHQCVRDISSLSSIPHLVLAEPCCEEEVALGLDYFVNRCEESAYLRLVTIPCEIPYDLPSDYAWVEGQGVTLREGDGIAFIGYGPVLLPEAWKAADQLSKEHGINPRIINLPWLNRLDYGWLRDNLEGIQQVITLDNHYVHGGQGDMIARALAETGLAGEVSIRRIGLEEVPRCGLNPDVLAHHGLDAAALSQAVLDSQSE